jgi:glycosyltransferase involved in cell wall biosynthesis
MKKLSIVVPAYNEEASIGKLLPRILEVDTESLGFEKEIVVVDDGSKDRTSEDVKKFPEVRLVQQDNAGKGKAVQRGIAECTGDYVLVQDADLEYEPQDYIPMLRALAEHPKSLVYGSRTLGVAKRQSRLRLFPGRHERQSLGPYVAGVALTAWTALLFQRLVTDTLTAYKIYPTEVIRSMVVRTHGFETDHELTAKFIRLGYRIIEVPIDYQPRSIEEGKKIRARDGLIAVWTLLRYRIAD